MTQPNTTSKALPVIISPSQLHALLPQAHILLIDMGDPERYSKQHIDGALWLDYAAITRSDAPAAGLVASEKALSESLSSLGLNENKHVVVYDDSGNGKAARLCYTLDAIGHRSWSLLDGGLPAWLADQYPVTDSPSTASPSDYSARYQNNRVMWSSEQILQELHNPDFICLDARSPAEYQGLEVKANNGGHIPGAANYNWVDAMDMAAERRLREPQSVAAELIERGLTPDKEIVAYCQTHHRSAYSYVMLKHLGYERIGGYPGAWSDWGNNDNLPVEV